MSSSPPQGTYAWQERQKRAGRMLGEVVVSDVDEAMAEADRLEQSLRAEIDNASKQS
jgi:hypothetical protein